MLFIIFLLYLNLIFLLNNIFLYFTLNINSKLIDIIINIFHEIGSIRFAFIKNGEFFIIFFLFHILLNKPLVFLRLFQITLSDKPLFFLILAILLFLLFFGQSFLDDYFLPLASLGGPFYLFQVFRIGRLDKI